MNMIMSCLHPSVVLVTETLWKPSKERHLKKSFSAVIELGHPLFPPPPDITFLTARRTIARSLARSLTRSIYRSFARSLARSLDRFLDRPPDTVLVLNKNPKGEYSATKT